MSDANENMGPSENADSCVASPSGSRTTAVAHRRLMCDCCGDIVQGTVGGGCARCRFEDEHLAIMRQALATAEMNVERDRLARRDPRG